MTAPAPALHADSVPPESTPFGAARFVPLAALLGTFPAGVAGAFCVRSAEFSPAAFLSALATLGVVFGAVVGLSVRSLLRRAARGEFPLPITVERLRVASLIAAAGAAGLAAIFLDSGVRESWILHRRDLLRAEFAADPATADLWRAAGGDGAFTTSFVGQDRAADFSRVQTAVNALRVDANRPDAYFRDTLNRVGVALPDWASRAIHRAVPPFAALLAAAVAWRVGRPPESAPGEH